MQDEFNLELLALDLQYEQIMGRNAFLYVVATDGPGAYHFTGGRIVYGVRSALAHMKWLLRQAAEQMGQAENEAIVRRSEWGWSAFDADGQLIASADEPSSLEGYLTGLG